MTAEFSPCDDEKVIVHVQARSGAQTERAAVNTLLQRFRKGDFGRMVLDDLAAGGDLRAALPGGG